MITSTRDLRDSEREFIALMTRLSFGRIERMQIQNGEVVLHPAPAVIRDVKFACQEHDQVTKRSLQRGPQFLKIGSLVRYRARDVEAWIDHQTVVPCEQPKAAR
jgi:hypothetical protein